MTLSVEYIQIRVKRGLSMVALILRVALAGFLLSPIRCDVEVQLVRVLIRPEWFRNQRVVPILSRHLTLPALVSIRSSLVSHGLRLLIPLVPSGAFKGVSILCDVLLGCVFRSSVTNVELDVFRSSVSLGECLCFDPLVAWRSCGSDPRRRAAHGLRVPILLHGLHGLPHVPIHALLLVHGVPIRQRHGTHRRAVQIRQRGCAEGRAVPIPPSQLPDHVHHGVSIRRWWYGRVTAFAIRSSVARARNCFCDPFVGGTGA